jgi:hypothetical protein
MTERDAAWMARILARFTPEMVLALAEVGQFTDPRHTAYVARVLEERLERILERYLTRLSPIASVQIEKGDRLCGVDLAASRRFAKIRGLRYVVRADGGVSLPVTRDEGARLCVELNHVARDGGEPDDAPSRYVRVALEDGLSEAPLRVHLYDLGPTRGYRIAGIERKER